MEDAAEATIDIDDFYRRLPEYLARLRVDGLVAGVEQESRLFLLLSRLESSRAMPKTAAALARAIVPVLAGTPMQQAICHDHFRAMFSESETAADDPMQPLQDGKSEEQKIWLRRFLRIGVTRAVAALAIIIAVVTAFLMVDAFEFRSDADVAGPTEKPSPTVETDKLLLQWLLSLPIKELDLPQQAPWNRTLRWYYSEFNWVKALVGVLPWLVFAAALGGLVYLTLAHLRRESLRHNLRTLPLSFRSDRPRFGDRALLAALQPLRNLARDEISEIDYVAMANATAERGGLLTPRWRTRLVPADFVFLIDRRSERDHLAAYGEAMMETLRSAGLFVEQFDFDRSPWICRRRRSGDIERLSSVLHGFPGAIYLFFVSESELLNPGSGLAKSWIGEIRNVARTFIVVPETVSAPSPLQWALPKGLMVANASPEGLRMIAARLLAQAAPAVSASASPALTRLVARLNERADRWVQDASPPAGELDRLVDEIRRTVGIETYRWIAATSVYPELRWPMTLYLRDQMGGRGSQPAMLAPDILSVAQLPWFRLGWMPDWVRTRLLKRLSVRERRKVRSLLLEAMGINLPTWAAAGGIEFTQASGSAAESIRSDRIFVDYLLPGLRSANQLFALPEEWAKRIARRPLRRLSILAACGIILSAAASFGALGLVPIDECDLWGTSPFQTEGIGPPLSSQLLERGGYVDKVVAACKAAATRAPDNVRFRYQYARALSSKKTRTPDENETVRTILLDLAKSGHIAAINSIGFQHRWGTQIFPVNDVTAEKHFMMAYKLGSLDAILNLIVIYEDSPEFQDDKFHEARNKLYQEYKERGGRALSRYAVSFRDGTFGIERDQDEYLKLLKLGADRKDGYAAFHLAQLSESGQLCRQCSTDYRYRTANKYYLKAIESDAHPAAAAGLAENYFRARGAEKNISKAFQLAVFAARLGRTEALDLIYEIVSTADESSLKELGVEPSLVLDQLTVSAESGNEYSQYFLGHSFEIQGNTDAALAWYRKASGRFPKAAQAVERLSKKPERQ